MPVLAAVERDHVLGDGERDARAAELHRVHVAIDPRRGAPPAGLAPDLEDPQVTAFGALADALHPHELRMRVRPVLQHARQLFVSQVLLAKWAHLEIGDRYVIIPSG